MTWLKKIGTLVLACLIAAATMPLFGCNAQSVLNDVEKFAPVITNTLSIACEFTSSPLCGPGTALLTTAKQHLFVVWQGYLNQEKGGNVTAAMWNDLDAALQDLITKSSDVFALAHVVNPAHQQEVLAVAQSAEALLAVIESFLPASPIKTMAMARPRLASFLPPPNPKSKSYDSAWLKSWEKNYNSLPAVKARKMQLHRGFWASLAPVKAYHFMYCDKMNADRVHCDHWATENGKLHA